MGDKVVALHRLFARRNLRLETHTYPPVHYNPVESDHARHSFFGSPKQEKETRDRSAPMIALLFARASTPTILRLSHASRNMSAPSPMTMEANIDDIELQPQFRSVGRKLNVNYLAPMPGFRILNFNFWWACCWVRPSTAHFTRFCFARSMLKSSCTRFLRCAREGPLRPCDDDAAPRCRIPCHKRQRARSVFSGGARVSIFLPTPWCFISSSAKNRGNPVVSLLSASLCHRLTQPNDADFARRHDRSFCLTKPSHPAYSRLVHPPSRRDRAPPGLARSTSSPTAS